MLYANENFTITNNATGAFNKLAGWRKTLRAIFTSFFYKKEDYKLKNKELENEVNGTVGYEIICSVITTILG